MTDGSDVNVVTLQGAVGAGRPAVSLVHGFTQNARCWSPIDQALAHLGPVIGVDLPGHGSSPPPTGDLTANGHAVAQAAAADLVVGYSLGGRLLLHGLLDRSPDAGRLVLIGTHPGIVDYRERRARLSDDLARADHLEQVGLSSFLDEWLRLPLFNAVTPDQAHLEARLTNDAAGVASALRVFSTGRQEPLWDRLASLSVPTLVLAGSLDDRYVDIGGRAAEAIGDNAAFRTVPNTGHACHLEDPTATAAAIHAWVQRTT